MWVYTPTEKAPVIRLAESAKEEPFSFSESAEPSKPTCIPVARNDVSQKNIHPRMLHKKAAPLLPAGMLPYGIGLALAGILMHAANTTPLSLLGKNIRIVFAQKPMHLFSTLYLSSFLALSLMFLLGYCPFGRICGKMLLLLYGAGTGLCCLGLLQTYGWHGWLLFAMLPGLYATSLSWYLYRLAGTGGRLSATLRNWLRAKENPPACRVSGRTLVDTYLMTCCMQGICCIGIALYSRHVMLWLF